MDIYGDIAAVTRRIAQLTGETPAATAVAPAGAGQNFGQLVSDAMTQAQPATPASDSPGPAPVAPDKLEPLVQANAQAYGVDPSLVKAIIANESGFDANATSRTGAQGLMQLEPDTASGLGVTDAYDPSQNISGGTRYIRSLLDRFQGDVKLAVAAYNAGPGAVEKYGGIPPYAETQAYVKNVLDSYAQYKARP